MLLTFSFALNPDTHEGAFAGNCDLSTALQIVQQLAIADTFKQGQVKTAETEKSRLAEESLRRISEEKRKS